MPVVGENQGETYSKKFFSQSSFKAVKKFLNTFCSMLFKFEYKLHMKLCKVEREQNLGIFLFAFNAVHLYYRDIVFGNILSKIGV